MIYAFRGFELDEELYQLRRHGRPLKLEPKVFDVLRHLLLHRDRVVSKQELLDAVWPDTRVSESVLPTCVGAARRALGDERARASVIQTVHARGYRFVAPVKELAHRAPRAPAPPPGSRDPAGLLPFVGRAAVLEQLRAGLRSALAGRGRLFLLVGEPGIGKTRTVEEFAGEAEAAGTRVLFGRCSETAGAPAFWPWIQILRTCTARSEPRVLRQDLGSGAADVAELVPELRERLRDLPASPAGDDEQARFRLFDGVAGFLRRVSARRPIVLLLDDLHCADEASLRLVQFLAAELRHAHLVVVSTYRDVAVHRSHPLARLLGALARETVCERIMLRGLEADDVERVLEETVRPPAGRRAAAAVHEMTAGNPFFISEVVRLLSSGNQLEELVSTGSLAMPQSARDAIGRHLDNLSEECNRVLRTVSVLGRELGVATAERLTGLPRQRLLERLDEACAAGVLEESSGGSGSYAFRHVLIQQTLYDELNMAERLRLHRAAGAALEEGYGALAEHHSDELAHHFFQAAPGGDPDKAVHYCTRAAARAHQLRAYEEAARHIEHALQALELRVPRDEARRCELLLELGGAHLASGARDRARGSYGAGAEIARRLGRADLFAHAAIGCRPVVELGMPAEPAVLALLEEALEGLGDADDCLRGRIQSRLAGTPPYSRSMETRNQLSREAYEAARREGDPAALRDALWARRWACMGPDRIDERFTLAQELLTLSEALGDPAMAALGYDIRMSAHLLRGESAAADRALGTYTRIVQDLRQPAYVSQALVWQGSRAFDRGRLDEAERLFREAFDRGRGTVPYAHYIFAGQMYLLRAQRGDLDAGEQGRLFFGEMMEMSFSWEPAVRSALALVHALRGDREVARCEFETLAERGFRSFPRDEHWLLTIGMLGGVASALSDRKRASELYALLEPYAELMMVHDLLRTNGGSVSMVLGNLATLLGRHDEGVGRFEHAMERESAMGARPRLLVTKGSLARLLQIRDAPGDRDRARALIDEVVEERDTAAYPAVPHLLDELQALASGDRSS